MCKLLVAECKSNQHFVKTKELMWCEEVLKIDTNV